jgi:hypothetical protein
VCSVALHDNIPGGIVQPSGRYVLVVFETFTGYYNPLSLIREGIQVLV